MKLTAEQHLALGAVAAADEEWRAARRTLEARLRAELSARVAELERRRAVAVRAAHEAGVPKRRIGVEGLHTSDPRAVYSVLGLSEGWSAVKRAEASGLRPATVEEARPLDVQPGEFLAHTPRGLALWTPAYSLEGVPAWHVVGAAGSVDAEASAALRADVSAVAELEALRTGGPRSGDADAV